MNAVGALLKKFRKNHEPPLTVPEFAGKVGVARSTAFRWESGIRKIDDDKLPRVVEFTGIPAKELRPDLVNLLAAPDGAPLAPAEGGQ